MLSPRHRIKRKQDGFLCEGVEGELWEVGTTVGISKLLKKEAPSADKEADSSSSDCHELESPAVRVERLTSLGRRMVQEWREAVHANRKTAAKSSEEVEMVKKRLEKAREEVKVKHQEMVIRFSELLKAKLQMTRKLSQNSSYLTSLQQRLEET